MNPRSFLSGVWLPGMLAAVGILWGAAALVEAQVVYLKVDKDEATRKVAFDWEGKDVSGGPIEIEHVEFVFRPHPETAQPTPLIRWPTQGPVNIGTNEYLWKLVLKEVPAGRYKLNVRARGVGGILGVYSNDLFLEVASKKPAALKNLRDVPE